MARTPRRRVTSPATAGAAAASGPEAARRVRENLPRPSGPAAPLQQGTPRTVQGHAVARKNRFGWLAKLQPRFIADIFAELKKVTWPSFSETRYLTIVVAIVALAVGIFLGVLDLFFGWVIEQLFF